ncbi:MAG: InlB B-repeat-containing protein [Bacillota bacterium]|nr:InlB B-repeat-containing protein [Bacillota bacterium]
MKNKKLFITIFSLFIVCVGVFCYFTFHQEEGFRIIKLIDFAGKVEIKRKDVGVLDPYNDLRLIADDKVQTYSKSKAYFSLDSDKYIYCHANSLVQIDSVGSEKNSRTKITLLKGNELNEIQNPLSSKAKYNVETPNSIMSVRGTVFKVAVKYDENGESYATLNVYEGAVKTELVFPDGTISDPIVVKKGYAVDTHGTDKLSEYIISKNATEDNDFVYPIDYSSLSKQELESLLEIYKHGKKELSISKEEVQELLKEKTNTKEETKYTVNFYNQDELLETQVTSEINYPNPNKKGHTFNGWYEDSNLTIKHESSTVTSDLNLYGKWTPKNYKISFDSQGGNALGTKEVTYDQTYGDLPTPTRQGYTFVGWYLNNTHITSQSKVQITQDTTLKASWKANEHTAYQVNHYQENLDNDDYTLVDSQQLDGTTDSQVTPNTHIYDGFKSPSKKEVIIKGDGSTVVNYYYQRNLYALTIDGDSGIASTNGQGNYRYGQNAAFNVEVKEGYTFDHFEINNEPITNNLTITKDMKVKAITKVNTYTIAYELNGGIADNLKNTYTVQDEYQLPIPKKKGYTFIGWNDGTQTNPLKDMKLSKGTTGNKIYTAYYKANTYQISFDTDGGNKIKDKTVTYNSTYGKLETPTKQGYTFVGWYLKDTPITEETQVDITSDTKLTAKWQANTDTSYKVKYLIESLDDSQKYEEYQTVDATGTTDEKAQPEAIEIEGFTPDQFNEVTIKGDGTTVCEYKYTRNTYTVSLQTDEGVETTHNVGSYKYGKEVTVSVDLKAGYQIQSWSYPENSTNKKTSLTFSMPAQNINIEVKTEAISYSVSYVQNDGVVNDPLKDRYTVNDEFTLPALTKNGYTFTGWTLEGSNADPITNYKVTTGTTGDLKFIAHFEAIKYSITYNDAEMEEGSVKLYTIETDTFTLPQPKAKTGYTFEGWKENDSDAPVKNLTITKGSTGDKTFTASWKANTYTITFVFPGGSLVSSENDSTTKTVTYDQSYGRLANVERPGYTFVGWFTEENGGSEINESTIVKITQNTSIYAHWTANTTTPYTVYYYLENLDGGWDLIDQQEFTGTTDTKVTPSVTPKKVIDLTGFKTPEPRTITIDGNGASSCSYNYYRNSYNVEFTSKRSDGDTTNDTGVKLLTGAGSYKYGSTVTLSVELKPGYEIIQWNHDNDDFEIIDGDSKTTAKIIVPASNVNVTVVTKPINYSIHLSQGDIKAWDGLPDTDLNFTFDSSTSLPNLTSKDESAGCTFAGWYYGDVKIDNENNKDAISSIFSASTLSDNKITLTAKWKKTYTVECTLENLSGNDIPYKYEDIVGFLGEPVMSAQELADKIANENNDSTMFEEYVIPNDDSQKLGEATTTITYAFKLKEYTVAFSTDDHLENATYNLTDKEEHPIFSDGLKTAELKFKYGTYLNLKFTPMIGYEVLFEDTSSYSARTKLTTNTNYLFTQTSLTVMKNESKYLHIVPRKFTITCDFDGGKYEGEDSKNQIYTIESPDISLPTPTKDGFEFKGYKLKIYNSETDKTNYGLSDEIYDTVSTGSTGNLNFVAIWEKNTDDTSTASVSEYNVYLKCERDYNEDRSNENAIMVKKLETFQLNDVAFEVELTSNHQHEDHKIVKWRRYYNDTQYVEYDTDTKVTIDPSNEVGDIYFVAVYDDE